MRHRRYGVYSPSRRSRASTHAKVLPSCYERSWIASGTFAGVFGGQRRGGIQDEAENADERALREAKRALVEKGRDAYLANVAEGENPCDNCPVPGLDVAYFEGFYCEGCAGKHTTAGRRGDSAVSFP